MNDRGVLISDMNVCGLFIVDVYTIVCSLLISDMNSRGLLISDMNDRGSFEWFRTEHMRKAREGSEISTAWGASVKLSSVFTYL